MEETYAGLVHQIGLLIKGTTEDMYALSEEVKGFCTNPENFAVLIEVLNRNTDEHIQKYTITLLKYCLGSIDYNDVLGNNEIINEIIKAYFNLKSIDVASHMAKNIFDLYQSKLIYKIGRNYLPQIIESRNPVEIEKGLLFLQCLCKITKSVCKLHEFAETLIHQGLSTQTTARVAALEFGIQYYYILENLDEEENILNKIYEFMGEIDEESFIVLCTLINWCANTSIDVFEPEDAIAKLLEIVHAETYTIKGIKAAHQTIGIIMENYNDVLIENSELLAAIADVTVAIAIEQFTEGDSLDMFPLDTFEIFRTFTLSSDVISDFVASFSENIESSVEKLCFAGFLYFTIEDEILYYEQEFDTVVGILLDIMSDESLAVTELVCYCLTKMAKIASDSAFEKAPEVEEAVYALFVENESIEILKATESILQSFGNTTGVFDTISSDLLGNFDESGIDIQQIIMNTLEALIAGSSEKSSEHFDELFDFLFTKATSDTEGILLPDTVNCIGKLVSACPEQMSTVADQVFPLLVEVAQQESTSIIKAGVNSLGYMLTVFPDAVDEDLLDLIIHIAQMNVGPDDLDDPSNVALRVATMIVGTHVGLAGTYAELLCEIIRQKGNADAAKASQQLLSALVTFPPDDDNYSTMIGNVSNVLIDIIENGSIDAVGYAMDALAIVFNRLTVETQQKLAQLACRAFTYELPALASHHEYSEDVHPGAKVLMVAAIHSQALDQVRELITELVGILVDGPCKQMRAAILAVIAEFIEAIGNDEDGLAEEFIRICIDEAKAQASEGGHIGFFCIAKLIRATGWDEESRMELARESMKMIKELLSKDHVQLTDEVAILLDNALSCMGTIVMTFPEIEPVEDYASLALSFMPIRMDLDENSNVMQFLLFIMERARETGLEIDHRAVIRVLATVFSDSVEDLAEQMLEQELIGNLAELFRSLQEDTAFQATIASVVQEDEYKAENINAILGNE